MIQSRKSLKLCFFWPFLDPETQKKRRRTYKQGLSDTPNFKSGGVKKVIVVGVLPEAKEEHSLLENFLQKINLQPGTFQFCADLKLINIAVGIMSHSSKHPCPFCKWVKNTQSTAKLRTFEGILEHFEAWERDGAQKEKAKHFFNCVRKPLSIFPKKGYVLDVIPTPQLHLKMGVTNKLFSGLEEVFPQANEWAVLIHVTKEDYHKQFEGMFI